MTKLDALRQIDCWTFVRRMTLASIRPGSHCTFTNAGNNRIGSARVHPMLLFASLLAFFIFVPSSLMAQSPSCLVWYYSTITATSGTTLCNDVGALIAPDFYWTSWSATAYPTGGPTAVGQELFCLYSYQTTGGSGTQPDYFGVTDSSADCIWWLEGDSLFASLDLVGDPINPALANVTKVEEDGAFAGASAGLKFDRFYNSTDSIGTDIGPAWRHSFDRSIAAIYAPAGNQYAYVVSPQYSSPATACTSGFSALQSQVSGWQGGTVSYQGGQCQLTSSSGQMSTIPIYSPYYASYVGPIIIEYDVIRDDGTTYRYPVINGTITTPPGVSLRFAITGSGYTVTDDDDNVETYSSAGVLKTITSRAGVVQTMSYPSGPLSTVTDSFGNSLSITRNAANTITKITFGQGGSVSYGYDTKGRLSTVTNLDSTTLTYTYGNTAFPTSMTAENDENNSQYVSWGYDSIGRANSAQLAGGALATTLSYTSNTSVAVTDALGEQRNFSYTRIGDANRSVAITGGQCPGCVDSASTAYDSNGWVSSRTDYNGNLTCYANDPTRGLELVRVEGFAPGSTCPASLSTYTPQSGTLQRKITTVWNTTWREPNTITEPNRTTSFTYDGYGNVLTKTVTDTSVTPNVSRTWTYKYFNSGLYGQVQTATGPRTDITTDVTNYTYYNCTTGGDCGQVDTVTNGLNQVTTFNTYNAYGRPLTITDPNGVVTTLTYDARERPTSSEVGTLTTSYSYWPIGLLKEVTLPDSSTVTYTYDGAHRLTTITDGAGNYIKYTLDALGNHTADNAYDPTGTLHRTHTRVFNTLSELYQDINAAGTSAVTTTYGYDANANQTSIDAPLGRNTTPAYDALNRLDQITDPNSGITKISYDANDNVASVLDPRSLTTAYTHDGFNEVTKLVSPDTGTSSSTYDSAGNLKTTTDARSALGTYTYDALNRMTQVAYTDQTINYTYDSGTYGKGRLTGASDANHTMAWTYNAQGRITGKSQTVASVMKSVGYGYTNDDLTSILTPSGQTIVYAYSNHRITSITINGTTLLSGVTYDPFGPATAWTWGNSSTVSRTYTEDGNPNVITTAGVTNTYTVDNASRITEIADSGLSSNTLTFGYDLLDRVTSGTSSALNHGYTYDANGNRLTETGTLAYTENIRTTNNQITTTTGGLARTYGYDAAGDTSSYTGATFTFNDRGRMSTAVTSGGTTTYIYNALGQLIEKSGNGGTTLLVYDEAGHLLGEYSSAGALIEETVWMGNLPVATLRPNGSSITIYYVHADHVGTPRKITNPTGNTVVWRWDPDTFGTAAPSVATIIYNLRFPGQYYMAETGLFQNHHRDYDPQTGRYIEPDPIGLAGGRNPYIYVKDNPISRTDRRGLGGPGVAGTGVDDILQNTPDSKCDYWPALCIAKVIVCTEATCTYTDCHGKPFVMEGVSFLPTPPNREELAKESPNCKCTKWKAFNDE